MLGWAILVLPCTRVALFSWIMLLSRRRDLLLMSASRAAEPDLVCPMVAISMFWAPFWQLSLSYMLTLSAWLPIRLLGVTWAIFYYRSSPFIMSRFWFYFGLALWTCKRYWVSGFNMTRSSVWSIPTLDTSAFLSLASGPPSVSILLSLLLFILRRWPTLCLSFKSVSMRMVTIKE